MLNNISFLFFATSRFDSKEEELKWWKNDALDARSTLKTMGGRLDEYMESSKELEREMEIELTAANNNTRDAQVRSEKLKGDVDEWKGKYQRALSDHNKTLAELNRELSTLRESHNAYKAKLRDMELDNDELENAERMVASSLTDMESRYNRAIERTAMLEEELVAKTKLEEENQRLKDELQEVKEELAVWQERIGSSRPATRTSTEMHSVRSGRSSVDIDRALYQRPSSRAGTHERTSSRTGFISPLQTVPSSSSGASAPPSSAQRRTLLTQRASLAASTHARRDSSDVRQVQSDGLTSSPSSGHLRARQSIGLSRSTASGAVPSRRSTLAPSSKGQQGASMKRMAGLLQNLRDLQATVQSATRTAPPDGGASAIPRPASRMSSSIGPKDGSPVVATPRRSVIGRSEEQSTPSAIPIPANGLSRSTSQRPPSRLSMPASSNGYIPPSVRAQTPNLEHYNGSLDFLDQDPAQTQTQYKRRSHLSTLASSTSINAQSSMGGGASQFSTSTRPRGSTLSIHNPMGAASRREDPLRKTIQPRTGKPAPPPVSLRQTINRPRSSSVGSNNG